MADIGPLPIDLQRKRITAEIKRLESMIENQELEIMETMQKVKRNEANIDASKQEIEKQKEMLLRLESNGPGEENE